MALKRTLVASDEFLQADLATTVVRSLKAIATVSTVRIDKTSAYASQDAFLGSIAMLKIPYIQ